MTHDSGYQSPDSGWLRDTGATPTDLPPPPPYSAPPSYGAPVPPPPAYYPAPGQRPIAPRGAYAPGIDQGSGMAVASLVLGIFAVIFGLCGAFDLPFTVMGVVFGILGLKSIRNHNLAAAGLILSIIGSVLMLGVLGLSFVSPFGGRVFPFR